VNLARGAVKPVNIPAWTRGFPLVDAFQRAFPSATSTLLGDAAAAALGEYQFGAGRGASALLGIVVSTGVGGGLVLEGKLHQGRNGSAGHIGHMAAGAEFDACACVCGATGCVEAVASGPSMQAWAQAQGRKGLTTEQLATAALAGDPIATDAFHRAARALAYAIVESSLLVELDVVVIGGGVAQSGDTLLEPVRAYIKATEGLAFARQVEIRPTQLQGTAGLLGAAVAASWGSP
jgi:glucokinase